MARSSSSSVTVPTWCSGSSYSLRANTSQTVSSALLIRRSPALASASRASARMRSLVQTGSHTTSIRTSSTSGSLEQRRADVVLDEVHRGAAHRGERELAGRPRARPPRSERDDQAHADDRDRDLGIFDVRASASHSRASTLRCGVTPPSAAPSSGSRAGACARTPGSSARAGASASAPRPSRSGPASSSHSRFSSSNRAGNGQSIT